MIDEDKWIIGLIITIVLTVLVVIMTSTYYTHSEKYRCIELRGEWIGKTCIFRSLEQIIVPKVYYQFPRS